VHIVWNKHNAAVASFLLPFCTYRLYKPVVRMWQAMALGLLLLQCCLGQSVRQDQIPQPAADECCQVAAPKATAWELASGQGGWLAPLVATQ